AESQQGRALLGRESWMNRSERVASRWSYLVRYRAALRRPRTALAGASPTRDQAAAGPLGTLQALRIFANAHYSIRSRFKEAARRVLGDYDIGGPEEAALRRTVASLRRDGIRV